MRCCGVYSERDWEPIDYPTKTEDNFPDSCCAWSTVTSFNTTRCTGVYQDGCIGRLIMIVERSALNLGTGAIAIALIQFTGIMFACTLGRAIRRQKTERERRKWELRQSLVDGYQPLGKTDPFITFPVVYMQSEPLKTAPTS
uniref:Tetraspanin n=1 Tax=Bracon brevicornis TaxID=1563983 RepID=A0A6V7IZS3_9HYME